MNDLGLNSRYSSIGKVPTKHLLHINLLFECIRSNLLHLCVFDIFSKSTSFFLHLFFFLKNQCLKSNRPTRVHIRIYVCTCARTRWPHKCESNKSLVTFFAARIWAATISFLFSSRLKRAKIKKMAFSN